MKQRAGILGAGISGIGAAILAQKKGYEVWVSDAQEIREDRKDTLREHQIPFEEKGHTLEKLLTCDVIIKSPGMSNDGAVIQALMNAEIDVIGEIEWAYRHAKGKIIAITGSNGKTTTTGLCHHFLASAGIRAAKVGNVGEGFCHYLAEHEADWYVCEVSSFQLEDVTTFRPRVAVLLNITPDHLDRYDFSLAKYAAAKMRIAQSMTEEDIFLYNAIDPVTVAKVVSTQMEPRLWSIRETDLPDDTKVYVREDLVLDLSSSALMGRHNQINVIAAARAALMAGCPADTLQRSLDTFVNEAHRLEKCGVKNGVTYINDSKATNVDAVYYALGAMKNPIVWIAGGQDKGNDYGPIMELVKKKVKGLICLGVDNKKLYESFSTEVYYIFETTTMREAVSRAASLASPGDVVLLSPACASFDLFRDYKDRGDQFKKEVEAIENV